jgi:hypothetical protein
MNELAVEQLWPVDTTAWSVTTIGTFWAEGEFFYIILDQLLFEKIGKTAELIGKPTAEFMYCLFVQKPVLFSVILTVQRGRTRLATLHIIER